MFLWQGERVPNVRFNIMSGGRLGALLLFLLTVGMLFLPSALWAGEKAGGHHVVSIQTVDDDAQPQKPVHKPHRTAPISHGTSVQRKKDNVGNIHRDSKPHRPALSRHHVAKPDKQASTPRVPVQSQQPVKQPVQEKAPVDVNHFGSLHSAKVNLRAGPGQRFPITWVYYRRGMPLKVLKEFDVWRYVELPDKERGWIQQNMLSMKRTFWLPQDSRQVSPSAASDMHSEDIKIANTDPRQLDTLKSVKALSRLKGGALLYDSPDSSSSVQAVLLPGTVGYLKQCPEAKAYCQVRVKRYEGWVKRSSLWGIEPSEVLAPSS